MRNTLRPHDCNLFLVCFQQLHVYHGESYYNCSDKLINSQWKMNCYCQKLLVRKSKDLNRWLHKRSKLMIQLDLWEIFISICQ